jgi:leader peptidase HopD
MTIYALPFLIIYVSLTLALGWIDAKTGLLPDRFTCPLLWVGLLFSVSFFPDSIDDAVLGAAVGYGFSALLYWIYRGCMGKEGLGYGDIKFIAALGAWHNWQRLPALALIACVLALLFLSCRVLFMRDWQAIKNPLRFGPFLGAAGFIVGWQQWLSQSL